MNMVANGAKAVIIIDGTLSDKGSCYCLSHGSAFTYLLVLCCSRQTCGKMASYGLSSPHTGHQLLIPALPLAGAKVHAEQGGFSAQEDPNCVQFQHGYS